MSDDAVQEADEEGYLLLEDEDIAVDDNELVLEDGIDEGDGDASDPTDDGDDDDAVPNGASEEEVWDADIEDGAGQSMTTHLQWVQSALFVQILIVVGILFLLFPKEAVSADEKRKLAPAPVFSFAGFFEGAYSDQAEAFYNDNFIYRNFWLALADDFKASRGYHDAEIQLVRQPTAPAETGGRVDPNVPEDPEFQKVKALVITKGRAVQSFGGTVDTVRPFAELMNDYRATLPASIKVYSMVIPSGSDFYLPTQVTGGVLKERNNIDAFNKMLDPGIVKVAAYDEIAPHTKEYIWFKTDHHWTGLGAYYAYRAFARAAGVAPVPLKDMDHKTIEGSFLGSLYYQTKDKSLQNNRDVLHYFKVRNSYKTYIVSKTFTEIPTMLYFKSAKGGHSYGVFLGGDHPLMRVTTDVKNGRKLLVIKDSYGNAMIPYFAANFEEITIVDYRYFKGTIPDLVQRYAITDFLYAQNSFAVNSAGTVKFGRAMLGNGGAKAAPDR